MEVEKEKEERLVAILYVKISLKGRGKKEKGGRREKKKKENRALLPLGRGKKEAKKIRKIGLSSQLLHLSNGGGGKKGKC